MERIRLDNRISSSGIAGPGSVDTLIRLLMHLLIACVMIFTGCQVWWYSSQERMLVERRAAPDAVMVISVARTKPLPL